jgi:glycosyltransferase involved in cell wall biosynthesis
MLADELLGRGHRVTWWTSRVDHFTKSYFDVAADSLALAPNYQLKFLDGRLYHRNLSVDRLVNHWQIGRAFRRECGAVDRPDAILSSFPTIELCVEAVRVARKIGVPVVLDVRDLWPDIFVHAAPAPARPLAKAVLWPYFAATRRALAQADGLIAVSPGYLEWGLAKASRAARPNDRVFPLAYRLPDPTPQTRASGRDLLREHHIPEDALVCLFAGTLGRTYDLAPVIEAARRLGTSGSRRFHFLICGEGERGAQWRDMATGLTNVTFTGWLDQTRMRGALASAHIGVAAYAADAPQGLPNKVIEYLAAGLPIVSSLAGETEALLAAEDCGSTFGAGDPDSLVNALRSLSDDAARAAISARARRLFESRFRAETIYSELADHLERVASQRHGDAGESRREIGDAHVQGTL